ncbi:MAG: PadR family transcriptional regulator [Spirochaetes bacterium]|nr:PadR family transcriptional regulator [Spirochaetota bacterium]
MVLHHVLLGLIKLRPSVSGYELKSIIDKSTGYFFTASLSQIYPALKHLHNNGFVTFKEEPLVGKQDRKVYTITRKGKDELQAWLAEPMEFTFSMMSFQKFLLKLTFMGSADRERILAYLRAGLDHYTREKNEFTAENLSVEENYIDKEQEDSGMHLLLWQHEFEYILKEIQMRINWIKNTIERIENETM